MQLKIITNNPQETHELGKKLALSFTSSAVISLVGEMGSGKTTFTKGFAEGLGCPELVTSPTFTLQNVYQGSIFTLNHFDFYRVESSEEILELGFEEHFSLKDKKEISIVEWASRCASILPKSYLEITLNKLDENRREIIIRQVENA